MIWNVIINNSRDRQILAVYGSALLHEAIATEKRIQKETGIWPLVRIVNLPDRPRVGQLLTHGKLGERQPDGRCSHCGASNFTYPAFSDEGVRGYGCAQCGTIKPERKP